MMKTEDIEDTSKDGTISHLRGAVLAKYSSELGSAF